MPRRSEPEGAESRAIREVLEEDDRALEAIRAEAGPPPDSRRLSSADEDEAWGAADPRVDHDAMVGMLQTRGLPPELVRRLKVVELRPEWAPLYQQPTPDPERAAMLARLARYPYRLALLEDLDDPDEQVAAAERLDRRFQQRMRRSRGANIVLRTTSPRFPTEGG